jgi:hypothetical protein
MRKIAVKILFLFAVAYGIIVLIYNRNIAEILFLHRSLLLNGTIKTRKAKAKQKFLFI